MRIGTEVVEGQGRVPSAVSHSYTSGPGRAVCVVVPLEVFGAQGKPHFPHKDQKSAWLMESKTVVNSPRNDPADQSD